MSDCRSPCGDCGIETHHMHIDDGEYYMVERHVWLEAVPPKFENPHCPLVDHVPKYLCISCLESRLGRRLTPMDFMLVSMNFISDEAYGRSTRLIDRMGGRFKDEEVIKEWVASEREKYDLSDSL